MNQTEKNSRTKVVLIIVGVVAALAIVGGSAYALLVGGQKKPQESSETKTSNPRPEVSAESLREGLKKLNTTVEQEKQDRANAQAAYDDSSKRIKLSN